MTVARAETHDTTLIHLCSNANVFRVQVALGTLADTLTKHMEERLGKLICSSVNK